MFNLNIPPSSLLGIEGTGLCSTPKTPEIVNSLIAMTNPMDNYNFSNLNSAASTPGSKASLRNFNNAANQSISQDSSHSSSSASPLDSPGGANTTPSVQQTCSQLIKAGLKLSIQSKRKLSTCDSSSGSEQPNSKCSRRDEDCDDSSDDDSEFKSMPKGLTPEDEDRRRRRRERNKIAATKCRMKKRERTQNLIKESEQLDTQNVDLKNQVRALETERRKLLDMLQAHSPTCVRRGGFNLPSKLLQSPAAKYLNQLELENNNLIASETNAGTPTAAHNQPSPPRTVIPPMSTIKCSRSNGFKAAAAANNMLQSPLQNLPNGYCKPSPTPQELGYLNSPSQETICLASLQSHHSVTNSTHAHPTNVGTVSHHLSDYIPNCGDSLSMALGHTPCSTPSTCGDTSIVLNGVPSPLTVVTTPTTAAEFVKNEFVDSQSPYTTAQSAERFLFESNCDSFVDIKQGVSILPGNHNNCLLNNNNNLLDFHTTLLGTNGGIVPFHDQISIKNDNLYEADLLAQLTGDGGEFVDLDTGVAAAFMTNGGCLA